MAFSERIKADDLFITITSSEMSTRALLQLFIVLNLFRCTLTQATSDTSAATTAASTSATTGSTSAASTGSTSAASTGSTSAATTGSTSAASTGSTSAVSTGSTSESASGSSTTAGTESTTAAASSSTTAASSASTESSSSTEASTTSVETTPPASPDNKICPSNSGMTDKLRVRSHEAHNFRRSRLAQGMVKNKMGRTLPQATNMYKLVYNCTLEKSAMDSANRCSTIQDPNLPSGVGENNYFFSRDGISSEVEALITGVKYWWSSIRKYGGMGRHVTYTLYNEFTPTKYFTQMAWATTQHFGCAIVSCGNYWSTVCHYSPKGNTLYQHVYERGPACSDCPPSTFCDMNKLCAAASTY